MKIYNNTKCPDAILEPILIAAGKLVGARTCGVPISVRQRRRYSSCGREWGVISTTRSKLLTRRTKRPNARVSCNGGYFEIRLPAYHPAYDPLAQAQRVFEVAIHEWSHIYDDQNNIPASEWNRNWKNRPHEQRAERAVACSLKRIEKGKEESPDCAILNLAVWIEEQKYDHQT